MANKIFGSFFARLIGKNVEQCADLETINSVVESKRNKKLHIQAYKSSAVPSRGNIFKYSRRDDTLDKRIDAYLLK